MFRDERGKPSLQEASIEIRVVGDDEHYPAQQIVYGAIVNPVTGDQLIGYSGNVRYFGRNGNARIFEPFPGTENFVNPPALTVVFEEAEAELDDFVTIGIRAGGFHIHYGGDELWTVIGWVVFGPRLQPTGDTIIAALDERAWPSAPTSIPSRGYRKSLASAFDSSRR
jgi:hypothetical protein